jgi:hypothetical protein
MFTRILYRDDERMLTMGPLGGLRIHHLDRSISRKLKAQERRYVSATVQAAQKRGMPIAPDNKSLAFFFSNICNAWVIGGVNWRATYFGDPEEEGSRLAQYYLEEQSRPEP